MIVKTFEFKHQSMQHNQSPFNTEEYDDGERLLWKEIEDAELVGEAEGFRYYTKPDGNIVKVKYKDYKNLKELSNLEKQDLLCTIINNFDANTMTTSKYDCAVIQGLQDDTGQDVEYMQSVCNYFNNLEYQSIDVYDIKVRYGELTDVELAQSKYDLIDIQKNLLEFNT